MNQPLVSVIIPCYNHGKFIDEAVDSVLNGTFKDFEILIINDGSTDEYTNKVLENYKKPKTQVFTTANNGPCAARNFAIEKAKGKYILPLDGDDKIGSTYIEKAVEILEAEEKIGVVYCLAELFGEEQGLWGLKEFSVENMLVENCIFCTALFRRSLWEEVGGYNANMTEGLEDYDFWLSLLEKNVEVYCIPQVLFYYRIRNKGTRNADLAKSKERTQKMRLQIVENHKDFYLKHLPLLLESKRQDRKTIEKLTRKISRQEKILKIFVMLLAALLLLVGWFVFFAEKSL